LKLRHTPALCSRLEDSARAFHHGGQIKHVLNRQTTGLLAVNILSGFGSKDRGGCVPAIASGHDHGVNVFPFEHLPHIAEELQHSEFPASLSTSSFPASRRVF
jgi:hypothetical protein